MKYLFALWAAPLVLFWGWFFLSLNDINFGYVMLTRQVHDLVFQLYGDMLGIDPAIDPGMVAQACIFDTALICGDLGVPPPARACGLGRAAARYGAIRPSLPRRLARRSPPSA